MWRPPVGGKCPAAGRDDAPALYESLHQHGWEGWDGRYASNQGRLFHIVNGRQIANYDVDIDLDAAFWNSTEGADGQVVFQPGVWPAKLAGRSGNWRELRTIVSRLEKENRLRPKAGETAMRGCVLYAFTDNSTAAFACEKGTSKKPVLERAGGGEEGGVGAPSGRRRRRQPAALPRRAATGEGARTGGRW